MTRSILYALLPVTVILSGCSPGGGPRSEDKEAGVVPAEVQQAALVHGKAIAQEAFGLLSTNLQSALRSGGVSNALPFCSVAALPLTDSVAKNRGVVLKRVTHKARNPGNRANSTEAEILRRFGAELTGTNIPGPVVTNLQPATVTFFSPIVLNNDLCLKCHGEPGKDISGGDLMTIRSLYPQDAATGFRLGELRGAWRVDFPIATLKGTAAAPPAP